jgi:transcriptional regulator with XRE-family HTH domain
MGYEPQTFTTPDGTEMVVLPATDYARLKARAEIGGDVVDARAALARIEAGEGTMPSDVLALILDEGLSPIAAWRRYRGLSQVELARRAGLSQVWVSRIEAGGGHGTPATRRKLAAALDAPLWALEGADEERLSGPVTKERDRKYSPLTDYLEQLDVRQVTMSFDRLGKLVGGLPNSAYQYQAWWQNNRGHSQSLGWTQAGFCAEPDLRSRTVTFRRVT